MPYFHNNGKLTESELKLLEAATQPMTLGDLAISTNIPFNKVKNKLNALIKAGYIKEFQTKFITTEVGLKAIVK